MERNESKIRMWKQLMIIALVVAGIQWVLVVLVLSLEGTINWSCLIQGVIWSGWAWYTLQKYDEYQK